jgi:transcriptional regulator with XRE-family HTH domain
VDDPGGDPFYRLLGALVREQRRAKGVTQEQLAELLAINRTTLVNIEKGRQRLAVHQLVRIADHLGCPLAVLIPNQQEEELLTDKQRSKVADDGALGFVTGVAAEARRTR